MSSRPCSTADRPSSLARWIAVAALAWCCASPALAAAASLIVNSLADNTTAGDGLCTLREAMVAANSDADFQDCAGSGAYGDDTIGFTVSGTITLGLPLPTVTDADGLTIDGAGQAVIVSGDDLVRPLQVNPGAELTLKSLTITRGAGAEGAGILNSGTLTITGSSISASTAVNNGGGLLNGGMATVHDSTFSGNGAGFSGGGISNPGTLVVANTAFTENHATFTTGGAIDTLGGTLTVTAGTFLRNRAVTGGAIMSTNGATLTVTGSTFSGNTASNFGGAIFTDGVTSTVANSTFAGNGAGMGGGGLVNNSALTVTNATFAGNTGGAIVDGVFGTTTLRNTIVARSLTGANCTGTITDGGGNLDDGATCGFSDPTSQSNANAGLDPAGLQDNGGPTLTIALVEGSDAIDRGLNARCGTTPVDDVDQRGVTRPFDGDGDGAATCDIGAFELAPGPAASLNHFFCYQTRASRGSLCAAESSNPGAACQTEEDCGGEEDVTAFCVPNRFPRGVRVTLTDQFERDIQFDVPKPVGLCNPASKNDEDPTAPSDPDHLQALSIREAKGQPRHAARANILIQNQFGELRIDTLKPSRLLVPTAKGTTGPVPEPSSGHDHFKCYTTRVTARTPAFARRTVALADQFGQPRTYEVVKPVRLCSPADKNGEAPGAEAHPEHLVCYQVKATPGQAKHAPVPGLHLANQFGPQRVDTTREEELCVPSQKTLPPE